MSHSISGDEANHIRENSARETCQTSSSETNFQTFLSSVLQFHNCVTTVNTTLASSCETELPGYTGIKYDMMMAGNVMQIMFNKFGSNGSDRAAYDEHSWSLQSGNIIHNV